MQLTDEEFDRLISRAMDELPQEYIQGLDNVVIVQADEPTEEQVIKMKLDNQHLLLGLYEGIPLTQRGNNYTFVLPDKITLFKHALLAVSHTPEQLFEQIKRTLWHEIAHFYGLGHDRIDELQARPPRLA
ncbi:metallopeptidase family protein [Streptomyces caniscabiei]|uniref:metallopeptidase family protein n=1 Tax=Streptomyces caniscabiei TaxID=2746961 RepID=UPI0029B8F674|nr:metallopeptidase family protein [Streptomyces caniscabiei]MDX2776239.1 metallopeptidase family protein [Streptomyces caniscabiei]